MKIILTNNNMVALMVVPIATMVDENKLICLETN